MTIASVLIGGGLGIVASRVLFQIGKNEAARMFDRVQKTTEESEANSTADIIGDTINVRAEVQSATDEFDRAVNDLASVAGCLANRTVAISLCALLVPFLGIGGSISFGVVLALCAKFSPVFDEYRYTMKHIEEMVRGTDCPPEDVKKIARKVYKELSSWVKPGRSHDEVFIVTNMIVDQYIENTWHNQTPSRRLGVLLFQLYPQI